MGRSIQKNGLINLLLLLGAGVAAFAVSRYASSLSGQISAFFVGLGVLVAFVSWFQMRLEDQERAEKLELEELARSKSDSALFESKDTELFPAQRARQQFDRFFVPAFTIVLFLLQAGGAYYSWRWISRASITGVAADRWTHAAAGLALIALILFIAGRFSSTISRLDNLRLLRPGASYLLLGAYLNFIAALAVAGVKAEFPRADLFAARGLSVLMGIVALETLVTLVLEIYRPRVRGKIVRPLYESRLVGLLGQPEGLITTAAQALDYQFGFKVSETWFYRFFEKAVIWLALLQLGVLVVSTSFVVIEAGEQGLLERFGKPVQGRAVLAPGPHLKLPWPFEKVYRYRTEQIQNMQIGISEDEDDHETELRTIQWTVGHGKEDNFLVANRVRPGAEPEAEENAAAKAPPVSLLTVNIPVQFQVTNLAAWVYNHADSSNLLHQIATREITRYLVSADLNEIMSHARLEAAGALRERIQAVANQHHLGANVLFVGLQGIHPPVKVASEYEKVVAELHRKEARILNARAEAIRTNALAGADAFTALNRAEADRLRLEVSAVARAAAFTNQLPAFAAAPSVYLQRAYFETFARAVAASPKYVLLTTNTDNVFQLDLQEKIGRKLLQESAAALKQPSN